MRTVRKVAALCAAITVATWAISPAGPTTIKMDVGLHLLALPYWTLVSIPGALLASFAGDAISDGVALIAPAPYAVAMLPQHRLPKELAVEAFCVLAGTAIVALTTGFLLRHLPVRSLQGTLAVAFAAVAARLPWALMYDAPAVTYVAYVVSRIATFPAECLVRVLGVPVLLGGPGGSPPWIFATGPISYGLLVVFTFAVYIACVYAWTTMRRARSSRIEPRQSSLGNASKATLAHAASYTM